MSFGKRASNAASGFASQGLPGAVAGFAASPNPTYGGNYTYNSPVARIRYTKSSANYQPLYSSAQSIGLGSADQEITHDVQQLGNYSNDYQNTLNAIPSSLNVNDYYNNPFRQSTYDLLSQPILQQYDLNKQQLSNDLNSQNQNGGSYAAMQYDQLNRNTNNSLNQANLQSIQASANAYNQSLNQNYQKLNAYNQYYNGLASNLSGLQSYYNTVRNQGSVLPSFFQR